jgi:HK97 family phage major capsid protein
MHKLKEILAKDPATLTESEKGIVAAHWDLLNDDLRGKFANCEKAVASNEDLDADGLKALIKAATTEEVESTIDEITKGIVARFQSSFESAREKAIETGDKKDFKENNAIVRNFLRALKSKDTKTLKELGMKAIDTTEDGSGADAGFTIPEPLANEVIRITSVGYGRARQLFAYNLLTVGNTKRVTALGSTLSVYWTDEGEKKGSSTPSFKLVTLALKKLAVIVPMTDEAIEDSGVDLLALTGQLIREAIDKEVDLQFFMGDGTVWTGIFNDATIPTTELANNVTIAGLRPEDIIGLADDTPLSVNGRYLMSRSVLSKVRTLRENADGTGNYLYNPLGNGGGNTSPFDAGTLNGYPVELAEAAPTATSAASDGNKPIMMFGDFQRGVAYGEKSDVRLKVLDQATITDEDGETVINLAEQDMTAIRAVQRVGMKVTLPGAMRRLVTGD